MSAFHATRGRNLGLGAHPCDIVVVRAARGTRRAYWGEWVDTQVYDGTQLGTGARIEGPALIEEPFTVVVLPPDAMARLDDMGNYVVTPQ